MCMTLCDSPNPTHVLAAKERMCIMSSPLTMRRAFLTVAFVWLAGAVTVSAADLKALLEKYLQASNRHNIATLRAMTAKDAVWQLGPQLLSGREAVVTPNECDAGANTRLEWTNIVVQGNTVDFELIERNDILRALGASRIRHFVRFTFENGLVKRKEARKPPLGIEAASAKEAAFRSWLRQTHPDALPRLWTPEDKFIFSREGCRLIAKLAADWAGQQMPRR